MCSRVWEPGDGRARARRERVGTQGRVSREMVGGWLHLGVILDIDLTGLKAEWLWGAKKKRGQG